MRDELLFEPGSFYVMDRDYMDFKRLSLIVSAGAFFVTRAKDNMRFSRQRSLPVDYTTGLRSHQIGKRLLKFGKAYLEIGQQTYEKLFKERTLRNFQRKARELGFDVTPMASTAIVS